jgi:hypothetical protein
MGYANLTVSGRYHSFSDAGLEKPVRRLVNIKRASRVE